MIRVLVDGWIYGDQSVGGINRYHTEILGRLGHQDNDIQVLLHLPKGVREGIPCGDRIRALRDWNLEPRRAFRFLTKMRARTLCPHVFHTTYYTPAYWPRLKSVVTVYDLTHERFPWLLRDARRFVRLKRRVIERADAVVAISHCTQDDILAHLEVDPAKITVIHPGVDEAFFASPAAEDVRAVQETYRLDRPYWLYVGSRGLYKNFGVLLRAFLRVGPSTDSTLAAVGGEPRLEAWQMDELIRNRLESRVRLLHTVTDDTLKAAYAGAAALIVPSLAEGFGIPLLEGMACGTPVLASDIPVFHEVAADAALYFDPHDEISLASAMEKVLDQDVRRRMIERGYERARAFSWDTAARKLAELYAHVV